MVGTYEDGALKSGDYLLNFGDLAAGSVITGGWMLQFSYQGRLTNLSVNCNHQDYQGMALSNLLYCEGGANVVRNNLQYMYACSCPDLAYCGTSVGGPINTYNGNYRYATTDLSSPTAGTSLVWERGYNSLNILSDTDTLSPGWTHRYAVQLEFPDMSGGTFFTDLTGDEAIDRSTIYYRPYVMVRLPEGDRLRLANNGDGTYSTYPGAQTTLFKEEQDGVVTYTLKIGRAHV